MDAEVDVVEVYREGRWAWQRLDHTDTQITGGKRFDTRQSAIDDAHRHNPGDDVVFVIDPA